MPTNTIGIGASIVCPELASPAKYNQPYVTYNKALYLYNQGCYIYATRVTQNIQLRARISSSTTNSLTSRANILNTTNRTVQVRARILNIQYVTQEMTLKGHIICNELSALAKYNQLNAKYNEPFYKYNQQCFQYAARVTQNLQLRASIAERNTSVLTLRAAIRNTNTNTIDIRGRIRQFTFEEIALQARIVYRGDMTLRGYILGYGLKDLSISARIQKTPVQSLQIKARLRSTLQEMTLRANIQYWLYIRARIAKRQGWPIPDSGDTAITTFIPTQLDIRARILPATITSQSLFLAGRIHWLRTVSMSLRAHMVRGTTMSLKASIKPYRETVQLPVVFSTASFKQERLPIIFYTQSGYVKNQLQIGAFVARKKQVSLGIIFSFPSIARGQIQTLNFFGSGNKRQTLGIRGRIG